MGSPTLYSGSSYGAILLRMGFYCAVSPKRVEYRHTHGKTYWRNSQTMRDVGITINRGRGATPEEIAARAANKLLTVANTAHPVIRDQANEFKSKAQLLFLQAAKEAAYNDRVTVYNMIKNAGYPDLAQLILKG